MTLIPLRSTSVGHVALAIRRYVEAVERVENLSVVGRAELCHLHATIAELDTVVNRAQFAHFFAALSEDGDGNLHLAEAASVAQVSVATLRRRLGEGVLERGPDNGQHHTIRVGSLERWIANGKPTGRRARHRG